MTRVRQCAAVILFVTSGLGTWAFADSQVPKLTAHEQRVIIAEFQELLAAEYVLEDKLSLFTEGLVSAIDAGVYSQPQNTAEFPEKTNRIIQDSFPDRHLGNLTPEKYEQVVQMFGGPMSEEHDAKASQAGHTPAHAGD